ncbi:hypothetical protein HXZ88_11015 [Myroides odoratimimus]|uniref:hypothetical protein n=1 Tax=Myroides odoratimimus TaxID=76832 RepID=UPI002577E0ED|nr:hypothetical protein [Myroides odoratimimus]MDM1066146.1 hypothetical protein [Myroides odoratimimus]MEC4076559.1 hypothetical protein [Myroides odoratimimus]
MGRIKKLGILLVFFLYIFNISFIFFPSFFSTRVWIAILGLFFFVFSSKKSGLIKEEFNILGSILIILVPSIITTVINNNIDYRFFGYVFQNIFLLIAAKYIVINYKIDLLLCCKYIVYSVLLHNLLSVFMFFSPSFSSFVINLQWLSENDVINSVIEYQSRFIGIGWGNFFFGGVICSITLLLVVYLYSVEKLNKWLYIYIFIFITGLFIARIVLVGFLLSFIYLIQCNKLEKRSNVKMYVICFVILALGVLYVVYNSDSLLKSSSFRHAFEIFINFFEGKGFSSSSTTGLKNMFILPEEVRTWVIGDGIFNLDNGSYYMFTDVGYLRLLFYFGIIGLVVYFGPFIHITKYLKTLSISRKFYYLLLSSFLLLLVSNIKGLVDFNWFVFLIFYSFNYKKFS